MAHTTLEKQQHGSKLYILSHDDPEFERLNAQSEALRMCFNGLTPCDTVVEAVLNPSSEGGAEKHVLDLGSGSGIWCVEMAKKFPHAKVLGVDLASPRLDDPPTNCEFETLDINEGLSKFQGRFDVVHARFMESGIRDHRRFMLEAERCLKPGGVIIVIVATYLQTEDGDGGPYPAFTQATPHGSWFQRILLVMEGGFRNQGNDMEIAEEIFREGLWDHNLLDKTTCRAALFTPPIGTWASDSGDARMDAFIKRLGRMWQSSLLLVHRGFAKGFSYTNRPQEEYSLYGPGIDEELLQGRHRTRMHIRALWGQSHREPQSQPQPPQQASLHVVEGSEPGSSVSQGHADFATIYSNQGPWMDRLLRYRASFSPEMIALIKDPSFDLLEASSK